VPVAFCAFGVHDYKEYCPAQSEKLLTAKIAEVGAKLAKKPMHDQHPGNMSRNLLVFLCAL
jgi:hypothetical protein